MQRECRPNRSRVETRDLNVKRFNACLHSGVDLVRHGFTYAAAIDLLDAFNRRVEVAAVAQVDLNLIGIARDQLFGDTSTGLEKVQARANLVGRNRLRGRRRDVDPHVADLNLSLNNETQLDWTTATGFLDDFDARIGDAPGVKQRLQRVAHTPRRKQRIGRDAQQRHELGLHRRKRSRAFKHQLDTDDLPAFVVFDPDFFKSSAVRSRDKQRNEQNDRRYADTRHRSQQ